MAERFVSAVSGYLPLLRFDRKIASSAIRWSGLGGGGSGHRSVAGWDEDPVTMAVEASRTLAAAERFVLASTSAYFFERSQAVIAGEALALSPRTRTADTSGSRRAGISAVADALLGRQSTVVAAAEKRFARAGSAQHLMFGDGAAAVRLDDRGAARCIGAESLAHDLVDVYASRDHPAPYGYEERFVREVSSAEVLVPTIRAALAAAGIAAKDLAAVAVAEPLPNTWPAVARALEIAAPNMASTLQQAVGDLGAAHPLYALGLAFATARPGDFILCAGFGSGCDALVFEVQGEVPGAREMAEAVTRGVPLADYTRFLSLTGNLDLAWGMRAEFEQKSQASVLHRSGRDVHGFIGGRDSLGNVQFPRSAMPVNPKLTEPEALVPVRLAEETGRVLSVTADRLNYTPDPPFEFGLVQFENGARVMMEFTDRFGTGLAVGSPVRMRFRIKSQDTRRGFRTYFWKAAPVDRPLLEAK